MKKRLRFIFYFSIITLMLITFAGCSGSSGGGDGGTGSGTNETPQSVSSSRNWDEMIWDQGSWE